MKRTAISLQTCSPSKSPVHKRASSTGISSSAPDASGTQSPTLPGSSSLPNFLLNSNQEPSSSRPPKPSPTSNNKPPPFSRIPRYPDGIPRSMRHAPPELHDEIRRRQNKESAHRSRQRESAERKFMEQKYAENERRIDKLENAIEELSQELQEKQWFLEDVLFRHRRVSSAHRVFINLKVPHDINFQFSSSHRKPSRRFVCLRRWISNVCYRGANKERTACSDKRHNWINDIDENALIGFKSLAQLNELVPDVHVCSFIYSSSIGKPSSDFLSNILLYLYL